MSGSFLIRFVLSSLKVGNISVNWDRAKALRRKLQN
jgi:hypothetical protein